MVEESGRKFSIPYNGADVDLYISSFASYIRHIDNVYLGLSWLCNNHATVLTSMDVWHEDESQFAKRVIEYDRNCLHFLEKSRGHFKRLVTLNSGFYKFTNIEIQMFVAEKIRYLVEKFDVDGFILTDFNMARTIHEYFPRVELHTSCNCFQWTTRSMDLWKEHAGISVFNPPREILRTPEKLREMKGAGFKLKCLVNESCLYGCPQTINHCMYLADNNRRFVARCNRGDYSNIFRSNWILPRWLKTLDRYVDVYKISGRNSSLDYIIRTIDAYITGNDDMNLLDLVIGGTSNALRRKFPNLKIPLSDLPDKLLGCECKECGKGCNLCSELMRQYI